MGFENVPTTNFDFAVLRGKILSAIEMYKDKDAAGVLKTAVLASGNHNFESRAGLNAVSFSTTELVTAHNLDGVAILEYLQYRYNFKHYPLNHIVSEFPTVLAIEVSSLCNLKCRMCFQSSDTFASRVSRGLMSFELFCKIIDEAKIYGLKSIVIASRGEPLLNPELPKMIAYAKANGILDVKLNTNALLLTDKIAEALLRSGVDTIVFSVDSTDAELYRAIRGADIELAKENIIRFSKMRKEIFSNTVINMRIAIVVLKEFATAQRAKLKDDINYWNQFVGQVSVKDENDFIGVYDGELSHCFPTCSLLWERLYVWHDGIINPCDIDFISELSLGNVKDVPIHELWHGEKMEKLRECHLGKKTDTPCPCRNCCGY
ncbi:MAG: radical SAM protein [Dysgonamonadaceae bacterium]|jgi:radical SAM protein with 4Fe4S-binding SPASM domain|nr:radical SAM protein [Dysgonamonadaceae bacterium]